MTTPLRERAEAAIGAVASRLEDPVAVLARLEQTTARGAIETHRNRARSGQ